MSEERCFHVEYTATINVFVAGVSELQWEEKSGYTSAKLVYEEKTV